MPIKHAIWTIGDKPAPLALKPGGTSSSISRCSHQTANNWRGNAWSSWSTRELATERQLETMIVADPRIVSAEWIGRQEHTPFGGILDLLAIASAGTLHPKP